MPKKTSYSRRPRPAACSSAREIHLFILRALDGVRNRNARLAKLGAERAALAVELASAGVSPGRNLARALETIQTSMFYCDTLFDLKIIDRTVHDYLRRRVDQIIAGLEQLMTTPAEHWLELQLSPLEAEPTKGSETAQPTVFQSIWERVAQAGRSILQSPLPSAGTGQLSEERREAAGLHASDG